MENTVLESLLKYDIIEKEKHFLVRYEILGANRRYIIKKNDYIDMFRDHIDEFIWIEILSRFVNSDIYKYCPLPYELNYNKITRDYILIYHGLRFIEEMFKGETANRFTLNNPTEFYTEETHLWYEKFISKRKLVLNDYCIKFNLWLEDKFKFTVKPSDDSTKVVVNTIDDMDNRIFDLIKYKV
jgi:hypothetical protein